MKKLPLAAALAFVGVLGAHGQALIGTGTYTQNFDGMGTGTTPAYPTGWNGWKVSGTGTALAAGSFVTTATNPAITTNAGSLATGTVYNFGTAASTDRALGSLASAGFIGAFGASFQNNTGLTLTASDVTVGFRTELWRSGGNSLTESLLFSYKIGGSLTDTTGWTSLSTFDLSEPNPSLVDNAAKDGNASGNFVTLSPTAFTGLSWSAGQVLLVRWVDADATSGDAGVAIDDFSLTVVPEPTSATLLVAGAMGMIAFSRRKSRAS